MIQHTKAMPPAEWSQKKSDLALAEHRHWQDARHAFAHVPRWYQASYPQSAWRGALHAPAIDSALPKFAHMLEKTAGTHHSDAFGMNMTRANDLLNASDGIRERLPEEHGAFCPPIRTSCSDKGNATSPRETTISEATTSPTCVEDIESYDPPSPSLAAASEPDDVDMENEAEVDKEADVEAEVEAENEDESKPKLKGRGKARKRSRYLRELDRRVILERLFRGEKQVVLAKEYNVSRAAICNLYKHRDEVLARTHEDPLAKHPKKRKPLCDGRPRRVRCRLSAGPPSPLGANALVQVQSDAILLQLTVLSDRRTAPHDFRRGMERLLWLFLEEALSLVPIKFTHVSVGENGATSHGAGVATEHPPCVISMEHHARSPMLSVVQSIDPAIPVGWVQEAIHAGTATTTLFPARQLPTTLKYHNVFLLDVAIFDWQQLCDRIACVKQHGALEVMLYVVVLFTSRWLIDRVRREFPNVHFVALHASSSWQPPAMDSPLAHVDLLLSRLDQVYETHYGIDDSETA